ncbi:FMN-linked oxidoreductase [Paxillus ammoniavirescens]|nr:FMN-linked oxidoreductase [Paxillus ammoniavirescens]
MPTPTAPHAAVTLGQPVTFHFSGKTAKNKFMKSAMSERLATFSSYDPTERGQPTEELIRLYETWAMGNIGIVVTGNIQIKKDHLEATGNAIIDRDLPGNYLEDYRKLASAAKSRGSLVLGQLSHPGRQVSITIQPYPESSSDIEHPSTSGVLFARPMPLTREGIRDIVRRFAYAASILNKAGFDGVQIHAAHGYLLHQFLSKRTNKRTDDYGGSLQNRARILLEIIAEIKRVVNNPSFLFSVKINSEDCIVDGIDQEEAIATVKMLEAAGVDLIEISGRTYEQDERPVQQKTLFAATREAYFIDFADRLRPHIGISKIAITGGFRTAQAMAEAIYSGSIDVVGIARPLTAEPFLVNEILRGAKLRAKEDKFPPSQLLRIAASASQIAEIGNGEDITDFSNAFNVSRFIARMQKEIPASMSEVLLSHCAV